MDMGCICARRGGGTVLIQKGHCSWFNRLDKAVSVCEIWYMKSTCESLLEGCFYVCIDQSLFTPIDADFVRCTLASVLHRDLTLFASSHFFHHFVLLFKPSFGWKCDTVTCHFLFISTDDKAFTFSILLHTWVFSTDLFRYWKINVHFIQ